MLLTAHVQTPALTLPAGLGRSALALDLERCIRVITLKLGGLLTFTSGCSSHTPFSFFFVLSHLATLWHQNLGNMDCMP